MIKMEKEQLQQILKNCKTILQTAQIKELEKQIPQYSWMLFLKLFDYYEEERSLLDKNFVDWIPKKFRWDDWANAGDGSLTGKPLRDFVDDELFPKLASLISEKGTESRIILYSIFESFKNDIRDGVTIRQIIEEINKIKFKEPDTITNLCKIYTEELRLWANDAEKNAYFYTPRALCKFIVSKIKPDFKKNEHVFDPACGLGGFLLESFFYMKKDEKLESDIKKLRFESLIGQDKNPDFFLCGVLNMMLNGINMPNLMNINSLSRPTKEIPPEGEYDIVMSNPSYNEPEAKSISDNLPYELKISESALHFLFLAMEELKKGGRAAIILPNGPLFKHGKADKIKLRLLDNFNLHTIVRLPSSIFAPRTGIDTNIFFFEKGISTKEIWYYELPMPKRLEDESKKKKKLSYNKKNPPIIEDFEELSKWFDNKEVNDYAWKVSVDDLKTTNDKGKIEVNLDIKNPNNVDDVIDLSPHDLIKQIISDETKTLELLTDVENLINTEIPK